MKRGKNVCLLFSVIILFIVSNNNIYSYQAPGDEAYAAFAEVMPEPVGGIEAIYKRIVYPEVAKKAGISGKVYVLVFVSESGSVDDVKVIKGLGAGCDEAVIDAVKGSNFKPASNKGAAAKVKLSLAFTFKLK
jgi:periplasmic protein TonB